MATIRKPISTPDDSCDAPARQAGVRAVAAEPAETGRHLRSYVLLL